MAKHKTFIAAALVAATGTVAMAGWLRLDAGDVRPAPAVTAQVPEVAETETALAPPQAPVVAPELAPVSAALTPIVEVERAPARNASSGPRPRATAPIAAEATPIPRQPVLREEPVRAPAEAIEPSQPAEPRYLELTIPSSSVIGVRLRTDLSSDNAAVEDEVEASVTRDVIAEGRVAIPAGSTLLGSVNEVVRGGKFKERARLSVRFHTLVLGDGSRAPVRIDSIVREGDAPVRATAAKIGGGAVGGAIIGGIMGGRKGAILGGAAGAGAATAAVAAGDRSVATLSSGSPLSLRLGAPVTVTVERGK
ncbi:MAG: hypothetical protein M3R55_13265 [Acidobacteriota bacterium]|nr:hypothetical protein [Acidobacteriota bacterium]